MWRNLIESASPPYPVRLMVALVLTRRKRKQIADEIGATKRKANPSGSAPYASVMVME